MSGSPRSGPSATEDPFSVLARFDERPAGLTSVALRGLRSSSVLKVTDLQTSPSMPDRSILRCQRVIPATNAI